MPWHRQEFQQNIFSEIITENFPNLGKDVDIQAQEGFRTSNRHDQKITSTCYIIAKMPRVLSKE
jgi:hypothetical protein